MTFADVRRELLYPVSHFAVAAPLVISCLLLSLSLLAGLFGIFLLVLIPVPLFRYLASILEARAAGRDAPAFDAELMSFVGKAWTLFPAVLIAAGIWSFLLLRQQVDTPTAAWLIAPLAALFPACLGVLVVTNSPLQSINPVAIFHYVSKTAVDYLVLLLVVGAIGAGIAALQAAGIPYLLLLCAIVYLLFLAYGMTGFVTARRRLDTQIEIPPPLAPSDAELTASTEAERQRVLTHAYGIISRGNRDAGLSHLLHALDEEADSSGAYGWYFNKMLLWEDTVPALVFAQRYVHFLLATGDELDALRITSKCLQVNTSFRPADSDREKVLELAELYERNDLLNALRPRR